MPFILWIYLAKKYLINILSVLAVLVLIIFVADFLEILRRTFNNPISTLDAVKIVIFKIPYFLQILMPFIILIATGITYAGLNRNLEIIAAKSAGLSIWNIITPLVTVSFSVGIIMVFVLSPIVSISLKKNMTLDKMLLQNTSKNDIVLSDSGTWLKEVQNNKLSKMIYAKSIYDRGSYFTDVMVVIFNEHNNYTINATYFADFASISNNILTLNNVTKLNDNARIENFKDISLATNISIEHLQKTVEIPEILSFFEIKNFIRYLKRGGFSVIPHYIYYYNLLLSPIFLCAITLTSVSCSTVFPRNGNISLMLVLSIILGLIIYLFSKTLYALGSSGTIPPLIATISPSILCILSSLIYLLHKEDG